MGFSVWLCVLCLQASLLSHALDCSEGSQGELCATGQTADRQDLFRRKRQLERRGPTHVSHPGIPGAVSVKGFPNTLIQADRSRRHLSQAAIKKKSRRKHRTGSFSLLSNDKTANPLQVTRVRRQVKLDPPKRGKSGRSGAFSVLGDPMVDGQGDRPEGSM
ncbi:uncharacterized protein si:dkey-12l12.1 isoform X2 [Cyprinodon tularosa]|uniref:uncharacterized protein si:dkey-12l12.1 isoform X2 n=1 Tax=Cyprinodon tularosa TaxID=77115 RepID=UPI0018E27060|nr:uncharacterized protein si:dkey-12l12.1 isoform X2 [Cyprinodon tularosa]